MYPGEHFWWGGWWMFPIIMPIVFIVVMVIVLYSFFGRGGFRPPWLDRNVYTEWETALDILKKRYATYAQGAGCLQDGFSFRNLPSPAGGLKNHLMHLHCSLPIPRMIFLPDAFLP